MVLLFVGVCRCPASQVGTFFRLGAADLLPVSRATAPGRVGESRRRCQRRPQHGDDRHPASDLTLGAIEHDRISGCRRVACSRLQGRVSHQRRVEVAGPKILVVQRRRPTHDFGHGMCVFAAGFGNLVGFRFSQRGWLWCLRQESNLYLRLRRSLFYPLNYGSGVATVNVMAPGRQRAYMRTESRRPSCGLNGLTSIAPSASIEINRLRV